MSFITKSISNVCVRFALSYTRSKMYGKDKIVGVDLFFDNKITIHHTSMPYIPNKWQNPRLISDIKNIEIG